MADLPEIEDFRDENFWGVVGDVLEWVVETEVSLGIVIILLLIGGIREGMAWWFSKGKN